MFAYIDMYTYRCGDVRTASSKCYFIAHFFPRISLIVVKEMRRCLMDMWLSNSVKREFPQSYFNLKMMDKCEDPQL